MAPSGYMAMITAGQSSHLPHVADRPGTCEEQAGRLASGRQAVRTRKGGRRRRSWGRTRRSRRVVGIRLTSNLPLVLILTFPSPSRATGAIFSPGAICGLLSLFIWPLRTCSDYNNRL